MCGNSVLISVHVSGFYFPFLSFLHFPQLFTSFSPSLCFCRNISDYDEDGQLNEAEFAVALHLAQLSLQHDMPIPSVLPEELRLVLQQATRPQLPVAKPTQLLKCSSAFLHFCENLDGQGFLKGMLSFTHTHNA